MVGMWAGRASRLAGPTSYILPAFYYLFIPPYFVLWPYYTPKIDLILELKWLNLYVKNTFKGLFGLKILGGYPRTPIWGAPNRAPQAPYPNRPALAGYSRPKPAGPWLRPWTG